MPESNRNRLTSHLIGMTPNPIRGQRLGLLLLPAEDPAQTSHRSRSNPWVFPVALLVSVGVHAVLLGGGFDVGASANPYSPAIGRPSVPSAVGLRSYRLVPVSDGAPQDPENAEEALEPTVQRPDQSPETGLQKAEDPHISSSVLDRLKPRAGDLRLWAPVRTEPDEGSTEGLRLRLWAEMARQRDSVEAAESSVSASTDWSHVDQQGRKWGVSPGRFQLGNAALPFCGGSFASYDCGFGIAPGRLEEAKEALWVNGELRRGEESLRIRQAWKEASTAIRARKEEERRKQTGTGG